jgi:hypothetical protein
MKHELAFQFHISERTTLSKPNKILLEELSPTIDRYGKTLEQKMAVLLEKAEAYRRHENKIEVTRIRHEFRAECQANKISLDVFNDNDDPLEVLQYRDIKLEFHQAQGRKTNAGIFYQQVIPSELSLYPGIDVFSPSPALYEATIDLVSVDADGYPTAFLPVKHTLRERHRMEKVYSPLRKRFQALIILVTDEPNPVQTQVDEILGFGFHLVMRDHLVKAFKTPRVHKLSSLPRLLKELNIVRKAA